MGQSRNASTIDWILQIKFVCPVIQLTQAPQDAIMILRASALAIRLIRVMLTV